VQLSDDNFTSGLRHANFMEVVTTRRRAPSWIAKSIKGARVAERAPQAPKLPTEFVAAMRQEVGGLTADTPGGSVAPGAKKPSIPAEHHHEPVVQHVVDQQATEAFADAARALAQARSEVLARTAEQLAELAQVIARRVIAHELSVDPSLVRGLVAEGLAALGEHDRCLVRVGERFASERDAIVAEFQASGRTCEVVVDATLDAYGCLVETELGRVDESLDARLATLLQALRPDSEAP
jgi:hypothetical protein